MKKLLVALVVGAMAMTGSADIVYNVFVESLGGWTVGGAGVVPNVGDQALVQLYAVGADGVIGGEVSPGGASGDDVILGNFLLENTGQASGEFGLGGGVVFSNPYLGQDIFARVFSDAGAAAGAVYFTSAAGAIASYDTSISPAPTPPKFNINAGVIQELNTGTVIPEPATIGLMGIAGLGMYLARRKVRR